MKNNCSITESVQQPSYYGGPDFIAQLVLSETFMLRCFRLRINLICHFSSKYEGNKLQTNQNIFKMENKIPRKNSAT